MGCPVCLWAFEWALLANDQGQNCFQRAVLSVCVYVRAYVRVVIQTGDCGRDCGGVSSVFFFFLFFPHLCPLSVSVCCTAFSVGDLLLFL